MKESEVGDEDDFTVQGQTENPADMSLWFDPNGVPQQASTPAIVNVQGPGRTLTRGQLAGMALAGIEQGPKETFLSKMLILIGQCHNWKTVQNELQIQNKLILDIEHCFQTTFSNAIFIKITNDTCRHLGMTPPDASAWSDSLKMYSTFVDMLTKYRMTDEEEEHIDSLLEGTDNTSVELRKRYHAMVEILVMASYIDKDILEPTRNDKHLEVVKMFWELNKNAKACLFDNRKFKAVLRKKIVDADKLRDTLASEYQKWQADEMIPETLATEYNILIKRGVALTQGMKEAVDELVFCWTDHFVTDGKPDEGKLITVCDYGLVTLVFPATEDDVNSALNHNNVINIVEENSHADDMVKQYMQEVNDGMKKLEEKKTEIEQVWNLSSPQSPPVVSNTRRQSARFSASILSGIQNSASRPRLRIATQPGPGTINTPGVTNTSPEPVDTAEATFNVEDRQPPRPLFTDQEEGNTFLRDFETLNMNLSRLSICPLTGRDIFRPRVDANDDLEDDQGDDLRPRYGRNPLRHPIRNQHWDFGAGFAPSLLQSAMSVDVLKKRIKEANIQHQGIPQLSEISERMTIDQLMFIEADINTLSESVKSIAILQREADKQGINGPTVRVHTDGGVNNNVTSSQWVMSLTRDTSLLGTRVRNLLKMKMDGEAETQKALLKSALDFKIPTLSQASEYLSWAVNVKEYFASNPAVLEAASANPGFLLAIKEKLKVPRDIQDTSSCNSARDLFTLLDQSYLSSGLAVHMAFKYNLGSLPKVTDQPASRQTSQMLKNISVLIETVSNIVKLDQWSQVRDEHVTLVEDRMFNVKYYDIYINITNRVATASDDQKREILQKSVFAASDMSILDETGIGLSSCSSVLDETPIHLKRTQTRELISLQPPTCRKLSPQEYCKIMVILATTVRGMTSHSRIRDAMRTQSQSARQTSNQQFYNKPKTSNVPSVPINNTEVSDADDIDEGVEIFTTEVGETKQKLPRAPCPLNCGHKTPLGSARWCKKFKSMKLPERKLAARDTPLCPRCLAKKHPAGKQCQAKIVCFYCKSPEHNTFLHEDEGICMNNTELEDEEADLSVYMTEDLMDEFEELDVNLTHLGQLPLDPGNCEFVNAIKYDQEAVEKLKSLIENAKPKTVDIELDKWDSVKREKMRKTFHDLKDCFLESKTQHLAELEEKDEKGEEEEAADVNLTELTRTFKAAAKVQPVPILPRNQLSDMITFSRPGDPKQLLRPLYGDLLDPALLTEILLANSSFLSASQSTINESYQRVSRKSFREITKIQATLAELCPTKQLNYCLVDVIIEFMTEDKIEKLSKLQDVSVRFHNQHWVATVSALLDEGSSSNLTLTSLVEIICPRRLYKIRANITTVNGSSILSDFMYKIDISTQLRQSTHSLPSIKMKQISNYKPYTQYELACLEHTLGIDEKYVNCFNLSNSPRKTYLLIGCNEDLNRIQILDSESIGLRFNLFSQRLKISYIPFASGSKFCISGSFGFPPPLICPKEEFPQILVPAHLNNDATILQEVNRLTNLLQSPSHLTAPSFLCRLLNPFYCSGAKYTYGEDEGDIGIDPESDLFDELVNINFTLTDARALSNYLEGEKVLITPYLLCPGHDKLRTMEISSCMKCAVRNQSNSQEKEMSRYEFLWDRVYKIEWKEKHRVMLDLPFDRPPDQIGKKFHSNILPALKASTALYKKCIKEGSLNLIDSQFRTRIASGQLTPLTEAEIQGIMDGSILSQFILRNKVKNFHKNGQILKFICKVQNLRSETSPSRLVANTSHKIDFSGSTLVTADPCAKHNLVDLLGLSLKAFTSPYTVMADLKGFVVSKVKISLFSSSSIPGAYLSVGLSEKTKFFFLNIWFVDPETHGTKYPICLKSENLDFGFGSASIILRIAILKYGVPLCKLEESKSSLESSTYIDNIGLVTIPNVSKLAATLDDIKTALDSLHLVVDKFYIPKFIFDDPAMADLKNKYNLTFKQNTTTLGFSWCLQGETIIPATNLTMYPTHRGMPTGESLKHTDLTKTLITRRSASRLVAQVWDNSGRVYGPAQAGAKWILTRICKILPVTEMDTPVVSKDEDLGMAAATFWTNISKSEIHPFPRCTLKPGWRIVAVVQDHDASVSLCGTALYIVSENQSGERESHILSSKSLLSWSTVVANEVRGHALASHLLVTVLTYIMPVLKAYDFHPVVIIVTDNLPSVYLFREDSKQTLPRNVRQTVLANLVTLHNLMPDLKITHCWLPSRFLSSDFLSKYFPNPADIINSPKWRHGDPGFLDYTSLSHFWFLSSTDQETVYRELPTNLEAKDNKLSIKELIANNILDDNNMYRVTFDANNHILKENIPTKKDDKVTDDLILNMITHDVEDLNIDVFETSVELEDHMGYLSDEYNAAMVNKHVAAMNVNTDEHVFMVLTRSRLAKQTKGPLPRCTPNMFIKGSENMKTENVVNGINSISSHIPIFDKETYDKLLSRTFNIVKLINTVSIIINWGKKNVEQASIVQKSWLCLLLSDQKHYGTDTKQIASSVVFEKGLKLVALRCHQMILPILDQNSPLLSRILFSIHHHPSEITKFPSQHMPVSKMRNVVTRSNFGVYTMSLDSVLRRLISKCPGCLRSLLRRFRVPQGERYTLCDPEKDLFHNSACDPLGPVAVRNHQKSRRSSLQCFVLVITCHDTGCLIMQTIADLTHQSIILGLKCAEQRYCVSFRNLYFDAGSSLSASLLEHDLRNWNIYQHPAMAHSRVYSESKISVIKPLWNKMFQKFSKENKISCPISIYELQYIISHLQLLVNQIPFSRYSAFSPAVLLHCKGLEFSQMFTDLEEADAKVQPLDRLDAWMRTLKSLRHQVMGNVAAQRSSLKDTDDDSFRPLTGDVCIALTGTGNKCDLVTVCQDGEENVDSKDKEKSAKERKDSKSKWSERTVLVRSGKSKPKPYPVDSLRLLAEGQKRKEQRLKAQCGKESKIADQPF